MRPPTVLNWALLCLNALLLVFLLTVLLISPRSIPWNPSVRRAQLDAEVLGMEVYCARGPFSINVAKTFPRNESFWFQSYDQPVALVTDAAMGEESGTRNVMLVLGEDFSVSMDYSNSMDCFYSPSSKCQIRNLMLINSQGESLTDFNVDGCFDLRRLPDTEAQTGRYCIYFGGEWCEVQDFLGEYHKRLVGGQEVIFDIESGQWRDVLDGSPR
jgi:hypothetical protein